MAGYGVAGSCRSRRSPTFPAWALLNPTEKLDAVDLAEDARHIDHRATTIGQDFAVEAPQAAPLPTDEFDITLTTTPRVYRYARITVRQALCSVPTRLIGQIVRAQLGAEVLVVLHSSAKVARNPRLTPRAANTWCSITTSTC